MEKKWIWIGIGLLLIIVLVCIWWIWNSQERTEPIDVIGRLYYEQGGVKGALQFCTLDNVCTPLSVKYSEWEDLAKNNTKVHLIGKIVFYPANRPNCEKSQMGCREFSMIEVEKITPLE